MYYPYYDQSNLARKTGSLIAKELPKDGNRSWKVITQPLVEPVSIGEVADFSRIDGDEENILIEGFIKSARMAAEEYMGRALISQTIQTVMDFWPGVIVELPRPPLISVTGIYTVDEDDTETEYDSDYYYLNIISEPGKIIIKRDQSLPINTSRDYGGYIIRSKHGYGSDPTDVPRPICEGIILWAAAIYATRVIDSKNPPPEAKNKFNLYQKPSVVIR